MAVACNGSMDTRQTVAEALRSFKTAMVVTHAQSGPLDARPMHIAAVEIEQGGPVWFITSIESHTAMELAGDRRTLLCCQDSAGQHLAVWGAAEVVNDRARLKLLWTEPLRAWFPAGADDPDLRLISFKPHAAELWRHGSEAQVRLVLEPPAEHLQTNL